MKTKFVPATPEPKWIRLPRSGDRCPFSGLTRTAMDQLVRPQACNDFNPPVDSKVVRVKGAKRGAVLISYESLMEYLEALPPQKEEIVR
jgi:hypothetical protein